MNLYGKWLISSLLTFILLFVLFFSYPIYISYLVDPLWNFNHDNKYNTIQIGFDERQQKTNYITQRTMNYEGLMIGTSRVTYMNQSGFQNNKVYNYGLSALEIRDYNDFLSYAEKQNGKSFDKVYLELYYKSFTASKADSSYVSPKEAFKNAQSPIYKYTSLFSLDTYNRAKDNKRYSLSNQYNGFRSYDRSNEVSTKYVNPNILSVFRNGGSNPNNSSSKSNISYSDHYKDTLYSIRKDHATTEFIPFTDPINAVRLKSFLSTQKDWETYQRWFEDMIDVYGTVYSFHAVNDYTIDPAYWFDNVHFYPNFGDVLVAHLDGRMHNDKILTIVTSENLQAYLTDLKKQLDDFHPNY